ncbi:lipopolysaccharide heptosyltransferase I [Candidatus Thioglobus sp.]|nr:lipopolysaccharide heptosyltransferase I [Candidatus Thioglobus sp.]
MRIAIVKLSAMGDIVHAMIVLQYIKKFNHKISIDWIVDENFKELLKFHPHINKVHEVRLRNSKMKKSIFSFFKELKKIQNLDSYDLVIDLQGLVKSAVISRFIPSKATLGFDKLSAREKIASFFYTKTFKIGYEENVIKRNFELIKFALKLPYNFKDLQSKLPFMFSSQAYDNLGLSNSKKNVLIIPGASHATKLYPIIKIARLSKLLDAKIIIIWGSVSERLLAEEIKTLNPKVIITDQLSLDQLISLVGQVDLVIGPDTGPTHLAWASNVPSVTIFGPTPGYRNTLLSEKNKIIESKSNVNPLKIDRKDYSIQEVKVEEVFKAANSLLIEEIN